MSPKAKIMFENISQQLAWNIYSSYGSHTCNHFYVDSFVIPSFHLKQGGKDKVSKDIAEYLLECVKDANLTSSGKYSQTSTNGHLL